MTIKNASIFFLTSDLAILRTEIESLLPFGEFGRSGGYGQTRSELKDAIRAGDIDAAQDAFAKLVQESEIEYADERSEMTLLELATYPESFDEITTAYFECPENERPAYLAR